MIKIIIFNKILEDETRRNVSKMKLNLNTSNTEPF